MYNLQWWSALFSFFFFFKFKINQEERWQRSSLAAGSKTTQLLAAAVGGPSWVIKTLRCTALEKAEEGKTPSAQDKRGSQPGDSKHRHGQIHHESSMLQIQFPSKNYH